MFRYFTMTALLVWACMGQSLKAQTVMTLGAGFEFNIHKAQVNAFEITWYFDKPASTSLLIAFDTNSDGQFKGQEKVDLIRMLQQFEAQDYLLELQQDSQPIESQSIKVISVSVEQALVSVRFGVLLRAPVNLQTSDLALAFVDSKRVTIRQTDVMAKLTGRLAQNCRVKVLENQSIDSHNWHHISCTK